MPSSPENDFLPTLDAWQQAVTPRTVALVINSPNNPTGTVADGEYLQALNQFAAQHNLYVVSDEVYDSLLYDGAEHVSFATLPGAKERTLLVNSLSKTYAMTGWRVGYLCAPKPLIDQALKVSQHSISNLAPFIQKAAAFALTDPGMAKRRARWSRAMPAAASWSCASGASSARPLCDQSAAGRVLLLHRRARAPAVVVGNLRASARPSACRRRARFGLRRVRRGLSAHDDCRLRRTD